MFSRKCGVWCGVYVCISYAGDQVVQALLTVGMAAM